MVLEEYDRGLLSELGKKIYPYGYVRWTETAQYGAFFGLHCRKAIVLKPAELPMYLTYCRGEKALISSMGKVKEPQYLGSLLKYETYQ